MKRSILGALTLGLAALTLAGVGVTTASSSGGEPTTTTIDVVELFTHDGSVDVAPAGPSQGDYLVFDDALVKPGTKQVVGHVTGTCFLVNVAVGLYNCPGVTFALPDGQIQSPGLFSLTSTRPGYGPIIGGTGAYAGASGETKGTAIGSTATDWVLTVIKR
jgi:hypothetical protein